ncbi:MAG: FtsX-like permease family protein [Bacteroidota bacterium]
MNFPIFFARRIVFQSKRKTSSLVVGLAVLSIALALATMEISLSLVQGFETEIQKKVIGFGSHIQIGQIYRYNDTVVTPLFTTEPALDSIRALDYVSSVSGFVFKEGLLKSRDGSEGVQLKGVSRSYDWKFFSSVLQEGEIPNYDTEKSSNEVLISASQARKLKLKIGDVARVWFFSGKIPRKAVKVVGIYETGMEEFDDLIVICDMRVLQRIWDWEGTQVTGFEVNLDLDKLERYCTWERLPQFPYYFRVCEEKIDVAVAEINYIIPFNFDSTPITEIFPEIFDWLKFQHQNVWAILILMIIVGVIDMTTVILILTIERTRTIGILKAMGLPNRSVQVVFIWNAFFLILLGIIIGNFLGLGILWTQDTFHWLTLNQEDYFIKTAPVAWVWGRFLLVNIGTVIVCTVFMFIPTLVISRITPIKAIRFS